MGRRGPAPGQGGRPPKPLTEKVLDGNPGKRKLTVVEFPGVSDFHGMMPLRIALRMSYRLAKKHSY